MILLLLTLVIILFIWVSVLSGNVSRLERTLREIQNKFLKTTLDSKVTTKAPTQPQDEPQPPVQISAAAKTSAKMTMPAKLNTEFKSKHKPKETPKFSYWKAILSFFITGNIPAKVGAVILLIGLGFLLRYTAHYISFPASARAVVVGLAALIMIGVGFYLRKTKYHYGLILQGGGIGILYLLIFISAYYHWLSPITAFMLLIVLSFIAVALSLYQDSKELIIIAELGALITPILSLSIGGSIVVLFSYYALINIVIAVIAWFKTWRELTFIGYLFTFVIASAWGVFHYQSAHYLLIQSFLIAFLVLYTLIPVLYKKNAAVTFKDYFDSSLVLSLPIIAFSWQCALVTNMAHGYAYSALGFGLYYALVMTALMLISAKRFTFLVETFRGISLLFLTLAPLLAFTHQTTIIIWAVESLLILYSGIQQNKVLYQNFAGALLLLIGLFNFVINIVLLYNTELSSLSVSSAVIVVTVLAACMLFASQSKKNGRGYTLATALLLFGFGQWYGVLFLHQLLLAYHVQFKLCYLLLFGTLWWVLTIKFKWNLLKKLALSIIPITIIYTLIHADSFQNDFNSLSLLLALILATSYTFLYFDRKDSSLQKALPVFHAINIWFIFFYLLYIGSHLILLWNISLAWQLFIFGLIPILTAGLLETRIGMFGWFLKKYSPQLLRLVGIPMILIVFSWTLFVNLSFINFTQNMPYILLINPVDMVMIASFATLLSWFARHHPWLQEKIGSLKPVVIGLGFWGLIGLSSITLRAVHYYFHIPYGFRALYQSQIAQGALTLVWTLVGLSFIIIATRRKLRWLWLAGATLFAAVLVKLFVIDLSGTSGLVRIVSFVVVGIILLLIGFFSPMPPKKNQNI